MTAHIDFRHLTTPAPDPLRAPAMCDQRGGDRRAVEAQIKARESGGKPNIGTLRDVSATGCRFSCYFPLRIGHRLWISLPGLESIHATVRWASTSECGCEFDRPLHPAVLSTIVARMAG